MFGPLQLKYFDLGYAFSDSTITFRQILCPRSYEFPLANSLSNNYLSGFLSGVIILFLLAFHMAEILTFDGYLNCNNMLVTKQFN